MPGDRRPSPEPGPPDLWAVGELCRLAHVARRLGCGVRLTRVTPALRELLELAGVDDLLLAPRRDGGPCHDA